MSPIAHARRWMPLLLAWAALAAPAGLAGARPAALAWSEPLSLAADVDSVAAKTPDLAVDGAGNIYVLWYGVKARPVEEGGGYNDIIFYRERVNAVWGSAEPIFQQGRPYYGDTSSPLTSNAAAHSPDFALRGSVTAAPDSKLHITIGSQIFQWYIGAPLASVVRSAALLPPFVLGPANYSTISAGADGTLHTALAGIPRGAVSADEVSDEECTTCIEILYRRSEDGGISWSRPLNLSRIEGADSRPDLQLDERGDVHVVWDHQGDELRGELPFVMYQRGGEGGLAWADPVLLGVSGEGVLNGALGVAAGGRLVVVYIGATTGSVLFQSSADGGLSWSPPGRIPGVEVADVGMLDDRRFSLAADGAGRIQLLMVGSLPAAVSSEPQLLHLTWDGQEWSAPATVARGSVSAPRALVERGSLLHAVWSTSERDADGLLSQSIWYSSAPLDAPALTPAPTFTPVPEQIPTAPPPATPVPTATPLPDKSRQMQTLAGPPRWEGAGLQVMMIALGPVTLLLGVVIWWARRRGKGDL